jgi:hypothetical protein
LNIADPARCLIYTPHPRTRTDLYFFLHECAHAFLHFNDGRRKPRYMEELEAFEWARDRMAEHGISVPLSIIESTKLTVAWRIETRRKTGNFSKCKGLGKHIDPRAIEFAGPELEALRQIRLRKRRERYAKNRDYNKWLRKTRAARKAEKLSRAQREQAEVEAELYQEGYFPPNYPMPVPLEYRRTKP